MKKLVVLLTVITICISFCSCENNSKPSEAESLQNLSQSLEKAADYHQKKADELSKYLK